MIELKRGSGDQIFIWFVVGMCALLVVMFGFAGYALMAAGEGLGGIFFLFALPFIGLTHYVYREAHARSFTRIAINDGNLELRLPEQRSYVAQEKIETSLPLSSIKAIEMRAESFRALGTTVLQYAYALVLNDSRRIVLGADRRFITPFFRDAASIISNQVQIPIRDLGLVDGTPGFLLVSGQTIPAWDAASVAPEAMQKRFKDEAAAWRTVSLIVGAALALGVIARAFS